MRTTSSGEERGGSWPMPTPAGVPVRITSPGCSVHVSEMNSISSGTEKIRLEVLESWRSSPLTHVRSARVCGIGDLLGGRDPRAVRAEAVGALRARPLRLAALQVAGGDVVGDRVARDRAARPHDDRQLALVVQAP